MSIWRVDVSLDGLNKRSEKTMAEFLGIEFIEIGSDYMVGRMPVNERTRQPIGIMHGGASCVLAETIGSTAANCAVDLAKQYCVGLDINTNHIRSIKEGYVIGTTRPYHIGRTTQVWGIEIKDEEGRLISVTRLTMAVLNR